ncbi:MAG: bile acid:sodium symporter [Opitutales bacterium]|nr:bile acid:sodium symporter [Opitutales bacterium]MCH8539377.1 bile acid:sodium symporter [Opitutales bacterium]
MTRVPEKSAEGQGCRLGFLRKQGFVAAVLGVVALAALWPSAAGEEGVLGSALPGTLAVMVLFFLQGISLPCRELLAGIRQGRFYTVSFLVVFVVSPLPVFVLGGVWWILGESSPGSLFIGLVYLALLPTTVSTSVVFSGLVKRDAAVPALYLAALTNLAGVFYVPLVFLLGGLGPEQMAGGVELALGIGWQLLLPLLLGQFARLAFSPSSEGSKKSIRLISHSCVLLILYLALSRSVLSGVWGEPTMFAWTAVVSGVVLLFAWLHFWAWAGQRGTSFNAGEKVAMWFCWPQKSAAMGVPLAAILFGELPEFGLILLPLLIYHPMQLLWGAWCVRALSTKRGMG